MTKGKKKCRSEDEGRRKINRSEGKKEKEKIQ
jgi:hypothetical protein